MLIFKVTLLFFLTSCALLRPQESLQTFDKLKLLDSVRLTGEGTGRLTLGESKYVFGVDTVLKENQDWILAVSIPLHGEEVLILPDLKKKEVPKEETDSFEERIELELERLKLSDKLASEKFLKDLRALIRFNLGPKWGKIRSCKAQQNELSCELDGETFLVTASEKEFFITKTSSEGRSVQLVAKNLTDSIFTQTDILLFSNQNEFQKKSSALSLELFWK